MGNRLLVRRAVCRRSRLCRGGASFLQHLIRPDDDDGGGGGGDEHDREQNPEIRHRLGELDSRDFFVGVVFCT